MTTNPTVIVADIPKSVIRIKLKNNEIWEILPEKLTAVKIPKSSETELVVLAEPEYDSIEAYLVHKGFKQINQVSVHVVTFEERMPKCTRCKTNKNVVKAGRQTFSKSKHRRYLCKSCNYRFTVEN